MTNARKPTRYPQVEVRGEPFELGRQIGEATREQIRGFVEIAMQRVNLTMPVSTDRAMAVADASFPHVAEYAPHMLDELRGMAQGAGVSERQLMMLQIRNQLTPDADAGCTAFAVAPLACREQHAIVAQNWDNDPALDDFTVVLTRRPAGKPAFMSVTQAGLIAYIGVNDVGIGVCMNTLPAPLAAEGVPHYFCVRAIYEQSALEGAVSAVRRARRVLPANVMMSTPQGPADIEVTIDDVRVLTESAGASGVVTHTNHCVHEDFLGINEQFPELIQSHARKKRIDKLFGLAGRPVSIASMQDMLRDRQDEPRSICRWSNEDPKTGYWSSVFSVVIEADTARMHLTRGNPCEAPYETYEMNQA